MSSMLILAASAALLVLVLIAAIIFSAVWRERRHWRKLLNSERTRRAALEQRFSSIVDADVEAARIVDEATNTAIQQKQSAEDVLARLAAQITEQTDRVQRLRDDYAHKRVVYDGLAAQIAIFDDRLAFAEMGIYEPHFDFDTSEEFKLAIETVREKQKDLVQQKNAVICRIQWSVDGSAAKGKTMTERNIRLTLRAFNGECDAAISNARWNNANAMAKRIDNARAQIDKHNASNQIEITDVYHGMKIQELRLTHEYREKIKAEKDERAEAARAAREEEKLIRDMERAEEEEARYQRLLEKAKAEAAGVVGPKLEAYTQQIAILERDLVDAHAKAERARALAEMTRSGYVYVISNLGSFGPDFVKIGLTRRLDPADRIRELGDASVPFLFDTHAVIYSDDAPGLERALHTEFAHRRVNAKNMRKEFFKVSIEEVEAAVSRLAPQASFFRDIEAQEYHETMALRNQQMAELTLAEELRFPASI